MLSTLLLVLASAPPASAPPVGPPAVCFPLDVGDARTLPWGGAGAFEVDRRFALERLVPEVVAVLARSDEALVHAETLRRAVIYVTEGKRGDAGALQRRAELVQALQQRALEAELAAADGAIAAHARALAWLDLGYVLGALDQMGVGGLAPALPALERACELAPDDGGVALAAWLAAWTRGTPAQRRDALLAAAVRLADDPSGPVRVNLMRVAGAFLDVDSYEQLAAQVRSSERRDG